MKCKVLIYLFIGLIHQGYTQLECYSCINCPAEVTEFETIHCGEATVPPSLTTVPPTLPPTDPTDPSAVPTFTLPPLDPVPTFPTIPSPELTAPQIVAIPSVIQISNSDDMKYYPRLRRDVSVQPMNAGMRCFRATHEVFGVEVRTLGCAQFLGTSEVTCAGALGGGAFTNCHVCEGNRCNSSSRLYISFVTLLAALFITHKLR